MLYPEKPMGSIYLLVSQMRNLTSRRLTGQSIMNHIRFAIWTQTFDIEISGLTTQNFKAILGLRNDLIKTLIL